MYMNMHSEAPGLELNHDNCLHGNLFAKRIIVPAIHNRDATGHQL